MRVFRSTRTPHPRSGYSGKTTAPSAERKQTQVRRWKIPRQTPRKRSEFQNCHPSKPARSPSIRSNFGLGTARPTLWAYSAVFPSPVAGARLETRPTVRKKGLRARSNCFVTRSSTTPHEGKGLLCGPARVSRLPEDPLARSRESQEEPIPSRDSKLEGRTCGKGTVFCWRTREYPEMIPRLPEHDGPAALAGSGGFLSCGMDVGLP